MSIVATHLLLAQWRSRHSMPGEMGSIEYSSREPFERAVQAVCISLASRGLRIAGQLDVSKRIERALGIVPSPCRIVFVLPNASTLSAGNIHPWAAMFLPLHIVISGQEAQTGILVQNRIQPGPVSASPPLFGPVMEAQAQIAEAIEAIAMRPSVVL